MQCVTVHTACVEHMCSSDAILKTDLRGHPLKIDGIQFAFLSNLMNQCGRIWLSVNSSENLSPIFIKTQELQGIKVKA